VTKTRSLGSFGIGTGTSSGWAWRRGRGWGGWCSTPFGCGRDSQFAFTAEVDQVSAFRIQAFATTPVYFVAQRTMVHLDGHGLDIARVDRRNRRRLQESHRRGKTDGGRCESAPEEDGVLALSKIHKSILGMLNQVLVQLHTHIVVPATTMLPVPPGTLRTTRSV
jgi:hypothetical protein